MKKKRIPQRFIRLDPGRSVAIMDAKTGKMKGRKRSGKSDGTRVRRVTKDVDVDHDGYVDFRGGTILGRTKAVKSSKRARGYVRKL